MIGGCDYGLSGQCEVALHSGHRDARGLLPRSDLWEFPEPCFKKRGTQASGGCLHARHIRLTGDSGAPYGTLVESGRGFSRSQSSAHVCLVDVETFASAIR